MQAVVKEIGVVWDSQPVNENLTTRVEAPGPEWHAGVLEQVFR